LLHSKKVCEIPGLMTDKEAERLYRLEDIGVCLWGYWGVERPGQPKLASKLAKEALQFSTDSSSRELQTSLLHRDIGKGRILLSLPSLKVVSPCRTLAKPSLNMD